MRDESLDSGWSPTERAVLTLANKFARNAYKVTEKDAISLREVGLDDAVYVDIRAVAVELKRYVYFGLFSHRVPRDRACRGR